MDLKYDPEGFMRIIDEAASTFFDGYMSYEEMLEKIYQESKKFMDASLDKPKLPPLNIRIYKPPNETRYKPDLFFEIQENINYIRRAKAIQWLFVVPRGCSRRHSIASYLIDLRDATDDDDECDRLYLDGDVLVLKKGLYAYHHKPIIGGKDGQ